VVAAAVAGIPIALRRGIAAWQHRRTRRLASWWDSFLRACDLSEESVLHQLEEHAEDPAFADVVGETAREVFEALDDAATVPLARLAKQYYGKKPPDWFSRGVSRMLREMSSEEIDTLRALASAAIAVQEGFDYEVVDLGARGGLLLEHQPINQNEHTVHVKIDPAPRGSHVFSLLVRNGLAEDHSGSRASFGGGRRCAAEPEMFRCLAALLTS
jgi:hypothetical protein